MPFAASCSQAARLSEAVADVCDDVLRQLNGHPPNLSFLFVSHAHAPHWVDLPHRVVERTGTRVLLGCTGETVIGGDQEVESGPALSLWCAHLPDVEIHPFRAEFARTPDGLVCTGVPADLDVADSRGAVFALAEPFSTAPDSLMARLAIELPGLPLLGGMASGGRDPGDNRLFLNGELVHTGVVGAVVTGNVRIRSVVSQGCRPIGTPFLVTGVQRNVITELGGLPALQRLQDMLPQLTSEDQALVRHGLHVGLAMSEYQESFHRGDFLIANVIGANGDSGAIAIGNFPRVGQTVQFHVRDAASADDDLRQLLRTDADRHDADPRAALLFSCNGRGTRLFPQPHHDAAVIQELSGPLPLAGFFAQGEFGPVGPTNYLHGYTASIALFE